VCHARFSTRRLPQARSAQLARRIQEVEVVALSVILFPPLLIAFLLIMERVEEPLRKPASAREVATFLRTASRGEVETLASSGIRRALSRWRGRRARRRTTNPPLV
jgi:hypothetical protein